MNPFPSLPVTQGGYYPTALYPPPNIPTLLPIYVQVPQAPIQPLSQAALVALEFLGQTLIAKSQGYLNPTIASNSTIVASTFASQGTQARVDTVPLIQEIDKEIESPSPSSAATTSSSSHSLSTSSTSITRENQTVNANIESEKEKSESELHSTSAGSKPTQIKKSGWKRSDYWNWPRDKLLIELFNKSTDVKWILPITEYFPNKSPKQIKARFWNLYKRAMKTGGILFPLFQQIDEAKGESIAIDLQKIKERSLPDNRVRVTLSKYWNLERDLLLIKSFNESQTKNWKTEIKANFPGKQPREIGNRLRFIVANRMDETGRIWRNIRQKKAKEGDFVILNIEKWESVKNGPRHQEITETAINAAESLRSGPAAELHLNTTSTSSSATIAATTLIEEGVENWTEEVIAAGSVELPTQKIDRETGILPPSLTAAASSSSQSFSTSSTSIREKHSSNKNKEKTGDSERIEAEKINEIELDSGSSSKPKKRQYHKWTWDQTISLASSFNKATHKHWINGIVTHFPPLKPEHIRQHFQSILKTLKNGRIYPLSYQKDAIAGSSFEINMERVRKYHPAIAKKMQTHWLNTLEQVATIGLSSDSSTPSNSSLSSSSNSLSSSSSSHVATSSLAASELLLGIQRKRSPKTNPTSAEERDNKRTKL